MATEYITTAFGTWVGVAAMAMLFATMMLGAVYILGSMLMSDKIKTWARMELSEVVYSAIIIVVAMAVIESGIISNVIQSGMDATAESTHVWIPAKTSGMVMNSAGEVSVGICDNSGGPLDVGTWEGSAYHGIRDCHVRLAIYYLDTIFHETSDYAFSIYIDYIWTSMMAEFTINIEYLFEMAGMFTFNPWKGFFTIPNSIKSMCFDWAMKIMLLNQFQEGMIRFIAVALYPVLFVSGAILRTFTFTRRLGGLLLGMALALYFVFPAFYAFGGLVIIDLKNNEVVRDAWVTDPMNPGNRMGGEPSLNPPIANSMYLIGDMPMIGGEGRMSTEDAHAYYYASRGMTPGEFLRQYEEGEIEAVDESGETVDFSMAGREGYDFTPNLDEPTDEETEARSLALQRARNVTNQWFDSVSNMNLLQKGFVTMAFQSNGIIDSLSRLTFFSVFFSLFSILGTIAAIRSLSVTFGGDMELAGLTRLI